MAAFVRASSWAAVPASRAAAAVQCGRVKRWGACQTNDRRRRATVRAAADRPEYQIEIVRAVAEFDAAEWNTLARQGTCCPFLEHDFLRCLEESGSASADTGWIPRHLALRSTDSSGTLLAVAPSFVKLHSMGEFVFDTNFADASYAIGAPYYPKLLVGVPFTPASGRRILTVDDDRREVLLRLFARALVRVCQAMELSSVHVNFCEEDEAAVFASCGFLHRLGLQFHWRNRSDYTSFDDFLHARFNSKKRTKLKRERAKVAQCGTEITVLAGDAIAASDVVDVGYQVYAAGIEKQVVYGRQYLNQDFFRLLSECAFFRRHVLLVVARDAADGSLVAGTFNIVGGCDTTFYGRYWGSPREMSGAAAVPGLHFECCYYTAIDYAIEHGLARIEPGAGGGESKNPRGFDPATTHSLHWFANPELRRAVGHYLSAEREHIERTVREMEDDRQDREAHRDGKGRTIY
jgi:uncharacterized protein